MIREVLTKPSVPLTVEDSTRDLMIIDGEEVALKEDWQKPYLMWLNEEMTPDDSAAVQCLVRKA